MVVGNETSVVQYMSLAIASELKLCQLGRASVQYVWIWAITHVVGI